MRSFSEVTRCGTVLLLLALTVVLAAGSSILALRESYLTMEEPAWLLALLTVQVTLACGLTLLLCVRSGVVEVSENFPASRFHKWLATTKARNLLAGALAFLLAIPWIFIEGEVPRVAKQRLATIPNGAALYASAKAGSPTAAYRLGASLREASQNRAALKMFQAAAKGGFADAQYQLAVMYSQRLLKGIEQNEPVAVERYRLYIQAARPPVPPEVEVDQNVPASLRNAVLRVRHGGGSSGGRSLAHPVGGSGWSSRLDFSEERLIAIRAGGFEIMLTRGDKQTIQTATVFFPFGQTTKASVLGWEVTGKFE